MTDRFYFYTNGVMSLPEAEGFQSSFIQRFQSADLNCFVLFSANVDALFPGLKQVSIKLCYKLGPQVKYTQL